MTSNPLMAMMSGQWLWQWTAIGLGMMLDATCALQGKEK